MSLFWVLNSGPSHATSVTFAHPAAKEAHRPL